VAHRPPRRLASEARDSAVGLRPTLRTAVVGAPSHFVAQELLETPPQHVTAAQLYQSALATQGGLDAWEFEKAGRELNGRVEGTRIRNDDAHPHRSPTDFCLAYPTRERVREDSTSGRLVRVPVVFG
jgi:hypothetical protein